MFYLLGCCLRAGDTWRGGNDSAMRVNALQIKRECHLRAIQFRIAAPTGSPNKNICEVCGTRRCERVSQADKGSSVRHAKAIVLESFTVVATVVREACGVSI